MCSSQVCSAVIVCYSESIFAYHRNFIAKYSMFLIAFLSVKLEPFLGFRSSEEICFPLQYWAFYVWTDGLRTSWQQKRQKISIFYHWTQFCCFELITLLMCIKWSMTAFYITHEDFVSTCWTIVPTPINEPCLAFHRNSVNSLTVIIKVFHSEE